MASHVELEPIGDIPTDARVRHYDELDETTKHRLGELVGDSASSRRADGPLVADLCVRDCDVIKFTKYYSVVCR